MNKENNRSAAGLRRSAVAERIRLREEWSALKGVDAATSSRNVLMKKAMNTKAMSASSRKNQQAAASASKDSPKQSQASDSLRGVVALVEVGSETKALPLRAALTAMGASVLNSWSPLVTHLVWTDSGCRAVRAKARALACKLVSPLWVEACAAALGRLNERSFPAASRHSDLPSPRTLRQLLKKAERENIPLVDLLSDSKDDSNENGKPRLRISSGTDSSTDKDTSNDTIDVESRVNTAPRRVVDNPSAVKQPPKSRRKLFTHKEAEELGSTDDETDAESQRRKQHQNKLTQRERRDLARAERMAKKLLAACDPKQQQQRNNNNNVVIGSDILKPKIVLTGMTRQERQVIIQLIQKLNGSIRKAVNKRTTHVLLGSCRTAATCDNHPSDVTGVGTHCDLSKSSCWSDAIDKRARTTNALLGAARGCRVLHARWALECAEKGKWLHHNGYEVLHLRRICQKARVERAALGRLHNEYAYDVFNGMRVYIQPNSDHRDAAIQLLTLCGAKVQDGNQYGGLTQDGRPDNGGQTQNKSNANGGLTQTGRERYGGVTQNGGLQESRRNVDVIIGNSMGEVNSKWVFDSVAAARMRTTRRYVNMNSFSNY